MIEHGAAATFRDHAHACLVQLMDAIGDIAALDNSTIQSLIGVGWIRNSFGTD